ncbi:hypothetical protein RHA1_ro02929 [Rhodococcus jostii RHA1]|uniref:Uncharacterized protein n=1 Tax=Rhodococcus jostii (strain RHA1) TaxID=101510 RepID=Q0SCK2_RHOJR|nr:hypothetical protein RHA1_ro02929 [Rhodococcus jostii RHA1]
MIGESEHTSTTVGAAGIWALIARRVRSRPSEDASRMPNDEDSWQHRRSEETNPRRLCTVWPTTTEDAVDAQRENLRFGGAVGATSSPGISQAPVPQRRGNSGESIGRTAGTYRR